MFYDTIAYDSYDDLMVLVTGRSIEMYRGLPVLTQMIWSMQSNCDSVTFSGNGRVLLCKYLNEQNGQYPIEIRLPRTGIKIQSLMAGPKCRLSPCGTYLIDINEGKVVTIPLKSIKPIASLFYGQAQVAKGWGYRLLNM